MDTADPDRSKGHCRWISLKMWEFPNELCWPPRALELKKRREKHRILSLKLTKRTWTPVYTVKSIFLDPGVVFHVQVFVSYWTIERIDRGLKINVATSKCRQSLSWTIATEITESFERQLLDALKLRRMDSPGLALELPAEWLEGTLDLERNRIHKTWK